MKYPLHDWLHKTDVKVYYACKMTNLFCDEMVTKALNDVKPFDKMGISVYHPVLREGIEPTHTKLKDRSEAEMYDIWEEDQRAIREAHVIVDSAASVYSTGAKREVGKSRYDQWKPLVTIWPNGNVPYIAHKEDDACVHNAETAAVAISTHWSTRWKRMKWRFPIYLKHWDNISIRKIKEFWR